MLLNEKYLLLRKTNLEVFFHSQCEISAIDTRGVVAKVLDCDMTVSWFELQSHYFVHFRINTPLDKE